MQQPVVIAGRPVDAVVFDTDGVVTDTARVHAAAWARVFDDLLASRSEADGTPLRPFTDDDYLRHVDGIPRYDGVARFLASRDIDLPRGTPDDPIEADTVCGIGNRKDAAFNEHLRDRGVTAIAPTVGWIDDLRRLGVRTAVVSASRNCAAVLRSAAVEDRFEVRVDGVDGDELGLAGKPDPAIYLEAARRLGLAPARIAVVEDAILGVEAARRGGFGLVVGLDRRGGGHGEHLAAAGADVVVTALDAAELRPLAPADAPAAPLPSLDPALDHVEELASGPRRPVVFLDYDGTLTPIVAHPSLAVLAPEMRDALVALARQCPVAVLSGRDLADVDAMVGLEQLYVAGSHGFDIRGPGGMRRVVGGGEALVDELDAATAALEVSAAAVPGAWVERKRFAIAVHYRQVDDADIARVEAAVDAALADRRGLRKTGGKKIFELRPDVEWDKGRALRWLLEVLVEDPDDALAVFLGDDETDEDGFREVRARGAGIVVGTEDRPTLARWRVDDTEGVRRFLDGLGSALVMAATTEGRDEQ
ncbi:MAG: trehalose-phosphatase [Acidimicrobiales bacterium]|jgi:alpha,alpha-trehalase|nr:trehalose-phosphatase [Acidimicrobiales bacterium]